MSALFGNLLARRGISMDRLCTLVMVADQGSIAAAAGKDNLTRQSQFSRQLKELEACFEQKLTERRGRTLTLTKAGLRLAALAREHFLALDRFASESGASQLRVRVGAGESILSWLLIPSLRQMSPVGAAIQWQFINLQAEDIQDRLVDQRLDFGLVRSLSPTHRLKHAKLGAVENILFVPRSLLKSTLPASLDAIMKLPLALLEGTSRVRDAIEQECRKRRGNPTVSFACTSAVQIASLIAGGQAAGPLPALARHLFDSRMVAEISLDPIIERNKPLVLAWNPRTLAMNPALDQLRSQLIQALSTSLAGKPPPTPPA